MPDIAYVDGKFLPLEQATVHVEDRGFQFADSVYEVVRTYGGEPFALPEHIARLFQSLDAIQLRHSFTAEGLGDLIREATKRAGFDEAVIYLQITRGRAARHRGPKAGLTPTVVVTVRQLIPTRHDTGIAVITLADERWGRCDIKSVGLLANVLAYQAARAAGADDAVFVSADGKVAEATAGNVFIVSGGVLRTPPQGPRILAGVTRDKVIRVSGCREQAIQKDDLLGAEEVFLTSTTAEIVPVTRVDGRVIGDGRCGQVTRRTLEEFRRKWLPG